ncbi:tetratricopeptide repeat protein [Streptomyces sp. 7R007]
MAQQHAIAAQYIGRVEQHAAPQPPVVWPVRVGAVPQLASAFQSRPGLRERIDRARAGQVTVVLTQVLVGGGGVGKSQLAAAYAHQALAGGTDLVVWVNAAETQQLVTSYASAAHRVQAPGASGVDIKTDAQAFVDWLAVTSRRWLVVLDDLTDLEDVSLWWPPPSVSGNGWVLATTRRRDALLSGGGRAVVEVDTYAPAEGLAYLRDRITGVDMGHLLDDQAEELAQELGLLPLALAYAAAYMINEDVPCARYLQKFTDRRSRLTTLLPRQADTEGYGRQVATALLLTLDAAQECEPVGLAVPAIRLAAYLDPAGHPLMLWNHFAVAGYLATHRGPPSLESGDVTAEDAAAAMRLLYRYGLITYESRDSHRAIRLHALTGRAVRETTPASQKPAIVTAAAEVLLAIWPATEHTEPDLCAVLRANTDVLAGHAGDTLWEVGGRPLLHQAGASLLNASLPASAVSYWERVSADAQRLLGDDDPATLIERGNLALAYNRAGRTREAITWLEQVAADAERFLGHDHPITLTALTNLAISYLNAERIEEATAIQELIVADRERLLGNGDPRTVTARGNLAVSYGQAGRILEAVALEEQIVTDAERLLGDHPDTIRAYGNLAASYRQLRLHDKAVSLGEQAVAHAERLLGEDHLRTVDVRSQLATFYGEAGRFEEAVALGRQVLSARERLQGEYHPDTLSDRAALAVSCGLAGHVQEAIRLGERALAEVEQQLGPTHRAAIYARINLATFYGRDGRLEEAITLGIQAMTEAERYLGDAHPGTRSARTELAVSYRLANRPLEAMALEDRAVVAGFQLGNDQVYVLPLEPRGAERKRVHKPRWWRRAWFASGD